MVGFTMTRGLAAHVTVTRGGFTTSVSIAIEAGQTLALLGPNGAGKSTVVAAIAGLLPIEAGRIVLDGNPLDDPSQGIFVPPEERGIGIVFQDSTLFPHLSVAENVAFGLRARNGARAAALTEANEWLDRLGLRSFTDAKPAQLSGGQTQLVSLARTLITEPNLLLLDEPLAALDVTARAELRHVLADYLDGFAGARLLITHDPTEAFLLADQIAVVEDGAITQEGTADDIRLQPRTPYVADLAGSNLIRGFAKDGVVTADKHEIRIANSTIVGPVLATVHPRAISVHADRPGGSPRNSWQTRIERVEHLGERVRLLTGAPLPLTAEITPGALSALGIDTGSDVWISVKATEIGLQSD